MWVYSQGHPLPYPVCCNLTLQRMDGATVGAWLYFPGTKVGQIHLYSSFLTILVALIINRYVVTGHGVAYVYS
jgi:hypothetical protein